MKDMKDAIFFGHVPQMSTGRDQNALERIKHLLLEEKLTEAQADQCIKKLKENGVTTPEQLAAFPIPAIANLGLKPKTRSVLKAVIPKLNGVSSFRHG